MDPENQYTGAEGTTQDEWKLGEKGFTLTLEKLLAMRPYLQTEDAKGHDAQVSVRIMKKIYKIFERLAFSRVTPYCTLSDSLRDALYLGLQIQMARYPEATDEAMDAEARAIELAATIAEDSQIGTQVEEVAKLLQRLQEQGELARAVSHLVGYLELVVAFPDPWRRRRFLAHLANQGVVRALGPELPGELRAVLASRKAGSDY